MSRHACLHRAILVLKWRSQGSPVLFGSEGGIFVGPVNSRCWDVHNPPFSRINHRPQFLFLAVAWWDGLNGKQIIFPFYVFLVLRSIIQWMQFFKKRLLWTFWTEVKFSHLRVKREFRDVSQLLATMNSKLKEQERRILKGVSFCGPFTNPF